MSLVLVLGLAFVFLRVRANRVGRNATFRSVPTVTDVNSPIGKPEVLPCPSAGLPTMQASQAGGGHHKVFLTWIGSARSDDPNQNPVGYCLYRSKKQKAAKEKTTCEQCEQVNSIPVPVTCTSCIDGLVEDNVTYYYVVTAINENGILSSASNEAPAEIPVASQTNSVAAQNPPLHPVGVDKPSPSYQRTLIRSPRRP
jgi:hypothetical protein